MCPAAACKGHALAEPMSAVATVPGYRIQRHTRHKSAEMVSRFPYILSRKPCLVAMVITGASAYITFLLGRGMPPFAVFTVLTGVVGFDGGSWPNEEEARGP